MNRLTFEGDRRRALKLEGDGLETCPSLRSRPAWRLLVNSAEQPAYVLYQALGLSRQLVMFPYLLEASEMRRDNAGAASCRVRARSSLACAELSFVVSQVTVLQNHVKIRIRKLPHGRKWSLEPARAGV